MAIYARACDTLGPLTVSAGLRASAARTPDKIALECAGRSLSYAALCARVDAVLAWVRELGVGRGDRVAVIAPNCLPYIELVAGISDAGAAAVTVNYRLGAGEICGILRDCGARVAFVHPALDEVVDAALQSGADLPSICRVPINDQYEARVNTVCGAIEPPHRDEWLPFSIPYTSGTTGAPKGVLISHRSRSMSFYGMSVEYGCFGPRSRFLALAPLCHGAGFAFAYAPLYFGGTVTLLERFDAEQVLRTLHEGRHDGVFMVPTHFESIFALPAAVRDACRGHGLSAIISNASRLVQPLKERIVDYFGAGLLHETYGSTEAGIVCNMPPERQLEKHECVGLPFHGTLVELRDADGQPVADGEPGELFSRNLTGFNGYWNNPQASAEAVDSEGWISVGDIARRDSDGFLYIVDRKKDVIISGGINIYPREVEAVIESVAGVREVAVSGCADQKWGEVVKAWVVPESAEAVTEADILAACREHLAGFKVPREIAFIDALPRNASGKVVRRALPA
jgi:long-chain acyl-CoA synthetase